MSERIKVCLLGIGLFLIGLLLLGCTSEFRMQLRSERKQEDSPLPLEDNERHWDEKDKE